MRRIDLLEKTDAGRDWRQEEKGTTEDEMAEWHHRLDGHEFEWTPGDGDGQGGLACCDSWGRKESDMTERLNWKGCKQTRLCTQPRWPTRPKIFTPVASYRKRPSSREEGLMVETLLALQTLEIGEHWEILWSSELLESAGQDRIGRYKKQREGNMFDSHSCERPAVL